MYRDEKERFEINVCSSRMCFQYFDFEQSVQEQLYEEREWSLGFSIKVLTSETGKEAAIMEGILFDELRIEEIGLSIEEAADYITQDEYNGACWMAGSEEYKNKSEIWKWAPSCWSGYMSRLYVYDEFRGNGIGQYLLSNLSEILKYSLNINLRCICTYPNPENPTDWSVIEDEGMKKRMIGALKKSGFNEVGNEGYYVKGYEITDL